MSPQEFWSIAAARTPEQRVGHLSLSEFEELRNMLPEGGKTA